MSDEKEIRIHEMVAKKIPWNNMFRQISGNKINLLVSHSQIGSSMSSNERIDRIWIVTKVHMQNQSPVVWVFELHPQIRKTINLKINEDNCLDPCDLYKKYQT